MYYCEVRIWDAVRGAWVFKQVATHLRDEAGAWGVAGELERASEVARRGGMTRERAMEVVGRILRIAGVPWELAEAGTWEFAEGVCGAPGLKGKSAAKYRTAMESFQRWAGVDRPLERWVVGDFERWYGEVLKVVSPGTANSYLRFWRSVFNKAARQGLVRMNPAAGVDAVSGDAVEKCVISRGEQAALCRLWRRVGEGEWLLLGLLGWHTGHRIGDLLVLGPGSFSRHEVVGWCVHLKPAKKNARGGREVVLPVPGWLARRFLRVWGAMVPPREKVLREGVRRGGKSVVLGYPNSGGHISDGFVGWLRRAGIDPQPVAKKQRVVHLKAFGSYRHAMASRLTSAGVVGELARLVTDHASPKVQRGYVHAEVVSLAEALRLARRR